MLIYTRDVVPASFKSAVYTVMLNKFSAKSKTDVVKKENHNQHAYTVPKR